MNRDEIAAARRGMGLTVTEAARAVGVGPETWRKWERGTDGATRKNAERIRAAAARHADAVGRARRVLRTGGTLAVAADDPRALAAAGAAQLLEDGRGRIRVQREAPPAPATE